MFAFTTDVIVKRDKYESRVLGIMKELDGVKIESIERASWSSWTILD